MKKAIFRLLFVAVVALFVGGCLVHDYRADEKPTAPHPAPIEQTASHLVQFQNSFGTTVGSCTGTAIGPHAFITAQHCNDGDRNTTVAFDYTMEPYHLLGHISDSNDHVIYFTDATFKNIMPYVRDVPHPGPVHFYGCGGYQFPCELKSGPMLSVFDTSDINQAHGMFYMGIEVIPGDSGSAIIDDKGHIVGLTTYKFSDGRQAAGFALAFTDEQITKARSNPL